MTECGTIIEHTIKEKVYFYKMNVGPSIIGMIIIKFGLDLID